MHQRRYFGTDGIRDVANRGNLTPDRVLRLGHAIGRTLEDRARNAGDRPRVVIVRDTRVSGPMIASTLTGALLAHGVDVLDAGVLPTPAAAFLVRRLGLALGLVVSASHNPMPDNGLKIFGPDGRKLSDDGELAIERLIDQEASRDVRAVGGEIGRLVAFDEAVDLYRAFLAKECFGDLDLSGRRIVIDCANGSGSRVSPEILEDLGARVVAVHREPDGLNINREAGVYHAAALAPRVRAENADFGVVLDGDGDRLVLIDETGRVLDGDDLLAILSRDLPVHDGERRLVATVMSNMGLRVLARERGLTLHETPVGDRYVAERMAATGAVVGGEQSGHIIFREGQAWFGDGLYTALRIARILKAEDAPLSRLASTMERFPQTLVNVEVQEKPPITELPRTQAEVRRCQISLGDEGRILVRYSGTEMLARVMVEGRDAAEIEAMAARIAAALEAEIGTD